MSEYERRYAEEISNLHTRLQAQLAGSTNKDKVQSYLNKTHTVGGVVVWEGRGGEGRGGEGWCSEVGGSGESVVGV